MNLLVVEDDVTIAQFICNGFKALGFTVSHVSDGYDALNLMVETPFDVAIVDLMLPSLDGLSLIRSLRERGYALPILILSARHTVNDRVQGLETGSDDYLVKPFSFVELQARVQALLRRRQQQVPEATVLQLADLSLDLLSKKVTRQGQTVVLQPREFALLEYLLRHQGKVLSKTMILEQVWDYQFDPQTNVVDVLVCRLRAKLDKAFTPKLLHTLRGVGYVLRVEPSERATHDH
ncbi:two-component system, OmpR family, response regulator [Oceanospirillum multiglobuliferum]|uniref:DNA-binding response regulator n=1 Tax=Oceanospirillum multiglobuliferum TaxID=64969 RepID=A0A1T4KC89_9GAMM|nr:response regulator transcription factor [Oceanospirillum multiglobuliferum]OPX55985.1 DNA-binding response regulator [Oceanospirillum multiglobuliferum]SJZ40039.1 two-component system, OmpR family, response regulator [Oceanospirillum multiglobuliferum]